MSQFKPTFDLLLTGKLYPALSKPIFTLLKGGLILRRWEFDRDSIIGLTRVYPEFLIGAGVDISSSASLSLSYQRINGGSPNWRLVSADGPARASAIPAENALLLDLTLSLL